MTVIQVPIAASTTALHAMTVRHMPARSDDPLRRVTLNLYEADCKALEHWQGTGWTTYIRNLVHADLKKNYGMYARRTLGDLTDD